MKRSSLYLLGSVMVLLAATLYVVKRPSERGMQRLRFAKLAFTKVDRIELSGAHRAALNKDGDTWRLSNGRKADAGMVDRLLAELVEVQSTEWLTDDPGDFEDMGVVGDKATDVQVESKGRQVLSFSVGAPTEAGSEPRVLYRDQVWQVEPSFASAVLRNEDGWLDRGVVPMPEHEVQALEVALAKERPYKLYRSPDDAGSWSFDAAYAGSPKQYRFDPSQASGRFGVLMGLQLQRFVDMDPGPEATGFSAPSAERWTVVGHGADEASTPRNTLVVGNKAGDGERYARIEGKEEIFVLSDSQVQGIRRTQRDLRALNTMASVNFDDVIEGGIERRGQKPIRLDYTGGEWSLKAGKGLASFSPDLVKVNQRMRKFTLARAIGIAEPKEGPVTPSAGRLWVKTKDGKEHALVFGPKASPSEHGTPGFWAKGTADNLIYRVSKPLYDELMGGPSTLEKASTTANKPVSVPNGEGLDSLPPDVRAKLQEQLAAQGQAG